MTAEVRSAEVPPRGSHGVVVPRCAALAASLLACLVLLPGCLGTVGNRGPSTYDSSSIVNRTNQFVLSGSVGNFSKDSTYTWQTSQSHPTASWSGYTSAGSVTITVKDQLGQTLYQRTHSSSSSSTGSEQLAGTVGGDWTIRIQFQAATASLSFSLQ